MVRPTIGRDRSCNTAATVEESTPPDMAMATSPGCVSALTGRVSNWVAVSILSILVEFALRGAARRKARKRFNTEVTEIGAQRAQRKRKNGCQTHRHRVRRERKRRKARKKFNTEVTETGAQRAQRRTRTKTKSN